MVDVSGNYRRIRERIDEAAARAGRNAAAIKVLAAAKSQSMESVRSALAAGISVIGENYVQEAARKKGEVAQPAEWHMIGHLQRNKCKEAIRLFDVIESLDSIALARELDKEGRKVGKVIRAYIEVNTAAEHTKSGVANADVPSLLGEMSNLEFVRVEGFMTIPPAQEDSEKARPFFRQLRHLLEKMQQLNHVGAHVTELSMGMSGDFGVAVEEGATIVRIGTALFGPRKN